MTTHIPPAVVKAAARAGIAAYEAGDYADAAHHYAAAGPLYAASARAAARRAAAVADDPNRQPQVRQQQAAAPAPIRTVADNHADAPADAPVDWDALEAERTAHLAAVAEQEGLLAAACAADALPADAAGQTDYQAGYADAIADAPRRKRLPDPRRNDRYNKGYSDGLTAAVPAKRAARRAAAAALFAAATEFATVALQTDLPDDAARCDALRTAADMIEAPDNYRNAAC